MTEKNNYQIEIDSLALGLTQPAMKFGVPMILFFISIVGVFFVWLFYQSVTNNTGLSSLMGFGMLWCVIYAYFFQTTSSDVFGLWIDWVNFQHFPTHPSNKRWANTDAYQP